MSLARMAFRNVARQRRRYRLLGAALAFCFFVIASVVAVLGAMSDNVGEKARIYYGGDFVVKGVMKGPLVIDDPAGVAAALREAVGPGPIISERVTHRDADSSLFFAGEGIRQRILSGVDFEAELELFSRFNYVEGGPEVMAGGNGILVSEPTAKLLGARVGDDILLLLDTVKGQRNTASLVLRGIFRDSSLFGYYTAYLDIGFLRRAIGMAEGRCSEIGVFYRDARPEAGTAERIHARLSRDYATFPLVKDGQEIWDRAARESWKGVRLAVLPLASNLEQVEQVLEAVRLAAAVLVGILLGVIVMGVTNTYRAIVFDRTREIGTMRALGMQRAAVAGVFLLEALLLATASSTLGLGAAWAFTRVLALADFSFVPAFDIFLRDGRVAAALSPSLAAAVFGLVCSTALLAASGSARRAASVEPAESLRSSR